MLSPSRAMMPFWCMRHEQSAPTMYSAPVAHHLVAAHLARHGVFLNGKHAAKAAALVAALGLDHLDVAHQAEQVAQLVGIGHAAL